MIIDIGKVVSGMKLSKDILLPNGTTLLNSPIILTESIIKTLKNYNIKQVNIEESPSSSDLSEDTDDKKEEYPKPKITVTVEDDSMSAMLHIEPIGSAEEDFTFEDLQKELINNNIVFGINETLLKKAVKKWHESKQVYVFENIAKGTFPSPAKESYPELSVRYINDIEKIKKAQKAEYCWEIMDSPISIQQVDKGTIIAKKKIAMPSAPGRNVFGDEIHMDEVIKADVKLDKNVEFDEKDNTYKSLITGLTYYAGNTIGIIPINFDGTAQLEVSSDNMKADIILHPAIENGKHPSEETVEKILAEKKVIFGIKEELVSKILAEVKKGVYPKEPIKIASGEPPVNGEDGTVEYLFNTETSLKPAENSEGKVDFKDLNLIQSVSEGDELARIIPPTEGTRGKDITGKELPCQPGTAAILPVGTNTAPKEDDPNTLIAETDGNVRLNGQVVEIFEGFIIKGNVNYSTGNIEYNKSVVIGGDIQSGFKVDCGGDLEVGGTIEDAELHIGGSVLCKYGFIGQGKGLIDCKGDVNIGFLKNQTIRCLSNVNIAKEALNGKIYARKNITVSGKSLSIAGGTLVARDSITCKVVGNQSGIHTTLEVGLDYTLIEEMEKAEKQIVEISVNKQKLVKALKKYEQMLNVRKKLSPKDEFIYSKLKNTLTKYETQVKALEDRKKIINSKLYDIENGFIKIENSAMPGTVFKIGERHHVVQEEVIGPKTVRMINYEIRFI